jgi:hypothetical protein
MLKPSNKHSLCSQLLRYPIYLHTSTLEIPVTFGTDLESHAAGREGISIAERSLRKSILSPIRGLTLYISCLKNQNGAMFLVASPELASTSMETLPDNINGT